MLIRLLVFASLLVPAAASAQAQPPPPVIEIPAAGVTQELELNDGSSVIGRVESIGADSAATIGLGYSYARTDDEDAGSGVVMIGGEHRVSRRVKLVTENYVFKGGGFASGGLRFFGEKLSADFGLVVPLFEDETFVFPMINIVRKF